MNTRKNFRLLKAFLIIAMAFLLYFIFTRSASWLMSELNFSLLNFHTTQFSDPRNTLNKHSLLVKDEEPVNFLLSRNYSTSSVFYVWCGSRWFEFSHYLSVLSVQKHIKPDNIIFYYEEAPVVDKHQYNTWFNELKETFPFFVERKLNRADHACLNNNETNTAFITNLMNSHSRIYVNESTILNGFPSHFRPDDLILFENKDRSIALLTGRKETLIRGSKDALQDNKTSRVTCVNKEDFAKQSESKTAMCITLNPPLFPKDIWGLDDRFGNLTRTLFYGVPEIPQAIPSYNTLVPNIAHMVWTGDEMNFLFYLGVLSLIYVAKVDKVYIHGDSPPFGRYWDLVKNNTKIQLIYRESTRQVYGTNVNVREHNSDIWRVDLMVKYGGIYIDSDAVFLKPLDHAIRGYDAVVSYHWPKEYLPYPNQINNGVFIGKRNAPYWREYQKSMKGFRDSDWCFNGCRQSYKVYERKPHLLKINPHVQITCLKEYCHPTWWPDYQNESVHHLNSPSIKDWKKDAYSFHWTSHNPPELSSPSSVLNSKTMYAEIGLYILQQAGMLEYFKKNN